MLVHVLRTKVQDSCQAASMRDTEIPRFSCEGEKGYVDKASRALTQSAHTAIDLCNTVGIMDFGGEKTCALDDWNQLNAINALFDY